MVRTITKLETRHESRARFLNAAYARHRPREASGQGRKQRCTRPGQAGTASPPCLMQAGIERLAVTTFGETNDRCAATFRRGMEVNRRRFENNCKLCGEQNGKSANDDEIALCQDEWPSVLQREQPFHRHCGSNAHTTRMQKRRAGPFCGVHLRCRPQRGRCSAVWAHKSLGSSHGSLDQRIRSRLSTFIGIRSETQFYAGCKSHAEAQSWLRLRRFTLDCDNSVEIDADES